MKKENLELYLFFMPTILVGILIIITIITAPKCNEIPKDSDLPCSQNQ